MDDKISLNGEHFFKDLSKEELAKYPKRQFEGKIIVLKASDFSPKHLGILSGEKLLGIDCEAKPSFTKGKLNLVSLIQIAASREVYLIRLNSRNIPDGIIQIFENQDIIKTGIGITHDIHELRKIRDFNPVGIVDLNIIAKHLGFSGIGLKKLSAILLGFTVSKKMQTSNWSSPYLSREQIIYAATDAWLAREIYLKLNSLVQIS